MDLGCIDMGCVPKSEIQSCEAVSRSENKEDEADDSITATAKSGKNKAAKESGQPTSNALNKFKSQIKKPSHGKSSPLNWFPRKKVDSYLKRKIKLLQELGGMNSTLDETLGSSNPHYTRVEKEKIAAKEAAREAMNARKAAMIEASWCRILQAARIQSKEAEDMLVKAEKNVAEAFEAAMAIGVIMYDLPNSSQKLCEIETPFTHGGESTTHGVGASFQTAFDVDKEVSAAVKSAFTRLANCSSVSKDEFKDLLRKISQNPVVDEEFSDFSSNCESDTGSEVDQGYCKDAFGDFNCEPLQRKCSERPFSETFNMGKLVDMMLERLKCLKEEQLASLATIVATCGLNAALAEVGNSKLVDFNSGIHPNFIRRMSSLREQNTKMTSMELEEQIGRKKMDVELPSLDKVLVKHMSKLEREVIEAKNARMVEENFNKSDAEVINQENNVNLCLGFPDLGSVLIKHSSKLEEDIEESKQKWRNSFDLNSKKMGSRTKQDVPKVPSLDKCLVKHVSKLEREVQVAKNKKRKDSTERGHMAKDCSNPPQNNSISLDETKKREGVSPVSNQKRRMELKGNCGTEWDSLDKVLVKHVSRLEREKMRFKEEEVVNVKKRDTRMELEKNEEGSLDKILVKRKSRLEQEKIAAAAAQQPGEEVKYSVTRREARDRELQEAWGGLGLGNSTRPRLSKLERDKAAWIKAEEEQKRLEV